MKAKSILRVLLILGFLAPFCYSFSQSEKSVSIKITKNDAVIIDTVINENISAAEIEALIAKLDVEDKEESKDEKNIEVRVIKSGEMNELDSLLKIADKSQNVQVVIKDNESGAKIEGKENKVEYEIKIIKEGSNEDDGETIIIEKEVSEE